MQRSSIQGASAPDRPARMGEASARVDETTYARLDFTASGSGIRPCKFLANLRNERASQDPSAVPSVWRSLRVALAHHVHFASRGTKRDVSSARA